jgi:hypothetical protein
VRGHPKVLFAVAALSALVMLSATALASYVNTGNLSGPGGGDGQLDVPERAAVEQSSGNLFVADSGNDRIQVFAPSGGSAAYLTQFGSGVLDTPHGIAIDESGGQTVVYVSSQSNGGEIVKFESDEQPTPSFTVDATYASPAQGTDPDQIQSFKSAIALAPNGDLWIADSGANELKRFDSAGAHVAGFNFDGSNGASAFTGLLDVAVNSGGDLYLIDANGAIESDPSGIPNMGTEGGTSQALRYGANGAYKAALSPVGPSQRPATVAVDPSSGSVAVSGEQDAIYRDQNATIHVFDASNASVETFSVAGPISYESVSGLAISTSLSRLYVVHDYGYWSGGGTFGSQPGVQVYKNVIPVPPTAVMGAISDVGTTTATFSGTVNPNGIPGTWRFQYREVGTEAWSSLLGGSSGSGESPVPVSSEATGLVPATEYEVRLEASGVVGGSHASEPPHPTFTTDPVPPTVLTKAASDVTNESARLNATIDPNGTATSYRFEFGLEDCSVNPCTSIPATEASAGSGQSPVLVAELVEDLIPGTTYHFRVLATNSAGASVGIDKAFHTAISLPQAGAGEFAGQGFLPGNRAWEMVSPVNKQGGDVAANPQRSRVAVNGDAVSYLSTTGFAGTTGSTHVGVEYVSRREANGWSTHSITPFQKSPIFPFGFKASEYVQNLSADLTTGVFMGLAPIAGVTTPNTEKTANLYLAQGLGQGPPSFELVSDSVNDVQESLDETGTHIKLADTSTDFEHHLFESTDNLTADAFGAEIKLYEWANGNLRLVGVLPEDACGSPPCIAESAYAGSGAASGTWHTGMYTQRNHTMSDDGSRIFFTAGALFRAGNPQDQGLFGTLYMREDGTSTVQIDASERSTPDPSGPGFSEFQFATPDGSKVFFVSTEQLTDEDTDTQISLYEYTVDAPAGERLALLSLGNVRPSHVVGISDDGNYVYLMGVGDPVPDLLSFEYNGQRLYAYHDGSLRSVGIYAGASWGEIGDTWGFGGGPSEIRVSPNGEHVLFASAHDQEIDAEISQCDVINMQPCKQLFLYSYSESELSCVSCSPSGEAPASNASFEFSANAGLGGGSSAQNLNIPLSNDGDAFFSTTSALVPQDTNGQRDVYMYDSDTGERRLLSSGQCDCASTFVTASPDGEDVFFTTRQALVRTDVDNLADLYDARVGGGLASQNVLPPGQCEGDACQPAAVAPNDPTPSSASFNGPGNPSSAAAKRNGKKRGQRKRNHAKKRNRNRGAKPARQGLSGKALEGSKLSNYRGGAK